MSQEGTQAQDTGAAPPPAPQPGRTLESNPSLAKIKSQGVSALNFLKEKSAVVGSQVKAASANVGEQIKGTDWNKYKEQAQGVAQTIGSKVQSGGSQVWQATRSVTEQATQSVKKMAQTNNMEAQAKAEASQRPCPRLVLACCHCIAAGGLQTEGVFTDPIQQELLDSLSSLFKDGHGTSLFPPGTTPIICAALLKDYLANLSEPLLTYKLIPQFLSCVQDLEQSRGVMAQLPYPNFTVMILLMDTCSRLVYHASENNSSAQNLASALAPVLAWHPLPKQAAGAAGAASTPASGTTGTDAAQPDELAQPKQSEELKNLPLDPTELQVLEIVIMHIIDEFMKQYH